MYPPARNVYGTVMKLKFTNPQGFGTVPRKCHFYINFAKLVDLQNGIFQSYIN